MIITFEYDESRDMGVIRSDFLENIRTHFSEFDPQAKIKKLKSNYRHIPSRRFCITKGGKFHLGMTTEIIKYVKSLGLQYRIFFTDEFKKAFMCSYPFFEKPLVDIVKPENYQIRPYQEEGIEKALKTGNGVFLLKTAAGKSYIIAKLIATINTYQKNTKALIIVPTIQLVEQNYKDLINSGFSANFVSKWSGTNTLNPSANIIIASSNILLSKTQDLSILSHVNLLIVDEVHMMKNENEITKMLSFINTRHRYGFTGTLPESKIDQWNIIGRIGPIICEVSRDELVQNKWISDAEIKIIQLSYNTLPDYGKSSIEDPLVNYQIENKFTENNVFRNEILNAICKKLENNVLVVVEHIEHGEILFQKFSENKNKQVFFIRGDVDVEDREKIKDIMEKFDNVVCVAISKIFSTGINIKNLHYILFASAGKAKVKIVQSIGRGLRLHENKNKLYIFDIADNLKYGQKHLGRRMEIYEEEGFKTKTVQICEK